MTRGFRDEDGAQRSSLVDITARLVRESIGGLAWLIDDGDRQVWIPKSQAEKNPDGTFTMPEWLATEKGLL